MTSRTPILPGMVVVFPLRGSGFLGWGTWLVLAVGLLLAPGRAFGSESKVILPFAAKEEYNSNIFYDSANALKDFVTTVTPGLEWRERTERLDFSLLGRMDAVWYAHYSEFDSINYFASANLGYQLTPLAGVSAGGGVSQDWRPNRDVLSTGLVYGHVRRDRWFYNLAGNYLFTERTSVAVQYNQFADDFNQVQYLDTYGQNASIVLTRDLDEILPRLKGNTAFGYGRYSYVGQESIRNSSYDHYTWTLGVSRALEPKWNFAVNLGGYYVVSEFKVLELQPIDPFLALIVVRDKTTTNWGGMGDISLAYQGEFTTANIMFRQDVVPASGYSLTLRTGLSASVDHRFTYELHGFLSASYFLNRADPNQYSQQGIDVQTFSGRVGLKYDFTKDTALEASYSYTRYMDLKANTTGEQNLITLRFTQNWALLE